MATNIILCTPATPNNVTLYDPALGCGGSTAWTKSLADTITLSDELAKSASKLLSDSVTLSDNTLKNVGLSKSDQVTLSEAISRAIGLLNSDNLTLSEAVALAVGIVKADAVTLSDLISVTGGSQVATGPFPRGTVLNEDKMSRLVREYIRDTVKEVSDKLSFSYARESDFNAIRNKKFPAVLLRPLHYNVSRNDYGRVLDYEVGLLFYDLDAKGDDERKTQKILDKLEPIVDAFQAKLNRKSLTVDDNPEDAVNSEKIVISDESIMERIKFTSDVVTGWEFNFTLSVPDPLNYCDIY